jgi:hypothetical protein
MTYLLFIDDADDAVCYHKDRLISMTCATDGELLLSFEGGSGIERDPLLVDKVTLTITADSERSIMEVIIKIMKDRDFVVIADDVKKAASTTITITDYTELNAGDKVNLVATDTTNYDFEQGDQSSVAGTFEATTSNEQTATNLMNVINTSSGPSGSRFTATVDGAIVTATQATGGVAGNTVVTITESGGSGMSARDFLSGTEGDYIDSRITACAIALGS